VSFKIYTKTGDQGKTSLLGGTKLPKSHIRIGAYGTLDELNAQVGLIHAMISNERVLEQLSAIQNRLFDMGSSLASDPNKHPIPSNLRKEDIEELEEAIDAMTKELPELKNFILPGGSVLVAQIHISRTVARRAERNVVALNEIEAIEGIIIQYLNRLSDYLFTLGRFMAQETGVEEIKWTSRPG